LTTGAESCITHARSSYIGPSGNHRRTL